MFFLYKNQTYLNSVNQQLLFNSFVTEKKLSNCVVRGIAKVGRILTCVWGEPCDVYRWGCADRWWWACPRPGRPGSCKGRGSCCYSAHTPTTPLYAPDLLNQSKPYIVTRVAVQHFKWSRIRIQGFDDQKWRKNTVEILFISFWSKIAIYLSLGLGKGGPSYYKGLQLSKKENIQHFSKWNLLTFSHFWRSFLPSWIWIQI